MIKYTDLTQQHFKFQYWLMRRADEKYFQMNYALTLLQTLLCCLFVGLTKPWTWTVDRGLLNRGLSPWISMNSGPLGEALSTV